MEKVSGRECALISSIGRTLPTRLFTIQEPHQLSLLCLEEWKNSAEELETFENEQGAFALLPGPLRLLVLAIDITHRHHRPHPQENEMKTGMTRQ